MFRWIGGLARCAQGKHERSEKRIETCGDHYISRCRYCGVRMRRRGKRDWIVEREPADDMAHADHA